MKKGGSLASDAVSSLVSQSAFDGLSKNFTNLLEGGKRRGRPGRPGRSGRRPQKGGFGDMLGSTHEAFSQMANSSAMYSNLLPGDMSASASAAMEKYANAANAKSTNAANSAKSTNTANAAKSANAANAAKTANAANAAKPANAATTNAKAFPLATATANAATKALSGGFLRNATRNAHTLSQLMNANSSVYSVMNRKRGGAGAPLTIDAKLNASALAQVPGRAAAGQDFLANEHVTGQDFIGKTVQYGAPLDNAAAPFSYGPASVSQGGAKRRSAKRSSSAKKASTASAKKAAPAKKPKKAAAAPAKRRSFWKFW